MGLLGGVIAHRRVQEHKRPILLRGCSSFGGRWSKYVLQRCFFNAGFTYVGGRFGLRGLYTHAGEWRCPPCALTYRVAVAGWPWVVAGAALGSCLGEREEFKTTAT